MKTDIQYNANWRIRLYDYCMVNNFPSVQLINCAIVATASRNDG